MNQLTDSNAWVGAAGFAGLAPAVFATPVAGILSDRFSRRRLLVGAYSAQAIVTAALLTLYASDALTPWRIIALMVVSGSIAGFMFAPIQSMAPILVPEHDLIPAVQAVSMSFTVGRAVGPALGAIVLALSGPGTAYGIACGCYVLAVGAMLSLVTREQPPPSQASFRRDFVAGLSYIRHRPGMRLAMIAAFAIGLLGAVWAFSLAASVADDAYGVGGGGLGAMATMIGVGSVVASIFIAKGGGDMPRSRLETIALLLYGTGILIAASTSLFAVGLAGYFVIGIAHMWHNVSLSTALQVQVDETHRGRVMSVFIVAILGGLPIGALIGGFVSDQFSIRSVMVAYGSLIIVFTCWAWLRHDRLQPLDATASAPG